MGAVVGITGIPVIQLHIGVLHIRPVKATSIIAIYLFCKHRETFVYPGFFIFVEIPVNHVLVFVGNRAKDVFIFQADVVRAEKEHFMRVGVGVDVGVDFICGRKVTRNPFTDAFGVKNVKAFVTIHSRVPFHAKEFAIGGDDVLVNDVAQRLQGTVAEANTIVNPNVDVFAKIVECGVNG